MKEDRQQFTFHYKGNFSVEDFLKSLAEKYQGDYVDNTLSINNTAFDLNVKFLEWIEGVKITVNSITFYTPVDLHYQTDQNDENLYFSFYPQLHFNRKNWEDKSEIRNTNSSIALIEKNIGEVTLQFEPQEKREWISIEIPSNYFKNIKHHNSLKIEKYLNEKNYAYVEFIPFEISKSLYELIHYQGEKALAASYLTYRLLELTTRFLFLIEHRVEVEEHTTMNPDDIQRMIQLENTLVKDASQLPYIPELCKNFGISESKLQKDFKQMFGTTVYKYFQNFRLETTKQLILETKYSMTQIALDCGFSSLKKFSTAFKEKYGLSPSEFRKSY
ncbi:AraC family transcriptional regulator [Flammeovirga sp. EKP202]|uniref:helix-turn-helix domain-containing protein n=1 Tax=Flammeovirga sp. EKP202 TaxID=2770592 RepID=UPI00165FC66A|nr:response regulator transcription factor [Flammeovirga sp. EKP202]MBD0404994.1 helix-turn-helix transcriptional regulator [Flammeovirga sp. EKP202]